MIKADVLAEDDDHVPDWSCRLSVVFFVSEDWGCEANRDDCANSECCGEPSSVIFTILYWHGPVLANVIVHGLVLEQNAARRISCSARKPALPIARGG